MVSLVATVKSKSHVLTDRVKTVEIVPTVATSLHSTALVPRSIPERHVRQRYPVNSILASIAVLVLTPKILQGGFAHVELSSLVRIARKRYRVEVARVKMEENAAIQVITVTTNANARRRTQARTASMRCHAPPRPVKTAEPASMQTEQARTLVNAHQVTPVKTVKLRYRVLEHHVKMAVSVLTPAVTAISLVAVRMDGLEIPAPHKYLVW